MSDLERMQMNDPTFVEDLMESQEYVWKAAQWLHRRGYNVTVRPIKIAPHISQMNEFSDEGDLEIVQRVEIKHRKDIDFQSLNEFPFKTVIVDVAHAWDKARPKPFCYIIFNKDADACLLIMGSTYKKWEKVKKFDRAKKRHRVFYECPRDLCYFFKVRV